MANGITRYTRPAQQPLMNTYVPLPYKELMMSGAAQQQQLDQLEAARLELGEKEFKFLPQDFETAKAAQASLDESVASIADLYGTNLGKAKAELSKLQRSTKKRFGQFGDIGAMQSNYAARETFKENERKRLEKGEITQEQYDTALNVFDSQYTGIGEGADGRYSQYQTEDLAKYVDFTDFANKYGDGIKADVMASASSQVGGDGYIRDFNHALEVVGPERVQSILSQYAQGSGELQNYLEQGERLGYTSVNDLIAAIGGATEKYSYQEESRDASTKTDSTWQYKDKLKKEADKKRIIHPTSTTRLVSTGDTVDTYLNDFNDRYNAIEDLKTKGEELQTQIASLKNPDGTISPENLTRVGELEGEYNSNQRELQTAEDTQLRQKDIIASTIQEVLGDSNTYGIEVADDIISIDNNKMLYKDKDYPQGYKDKATGNFIDIDEITPEEAEARGYETVYKISSTDWVDFDYRIKDQLKGKLTERAATGKDYTVFHFTDSDRSEIATDEISGLTENVLDNPQEYNVRLYDPSTGDYKEVPYADLGEAIDVLQYAKPENIQKRIDDAKEAGATEQEILKIYAEADARRSIAGKEIWKKGFELDGILNDEDQSLVFKTVTGDKLMITPKANTQSHKAITQSIMGKISSTTQDAEATSVYLQQLYPDYYNKYKTAEEDLSEHSAYKRDQVINAMQPDLVGLTPEGQGVYLHTGKGRHKDTVHLWMSLDKETAEYPTKGEQIQEIPQTTLANQALLIKANFGIQ